MQNHLPLCSINKNGASLTARIQGGFVLFMWAKWDHSLSFLFFPPNKVTPTEALQAEQTGAGFAQNLRNHRNGGSGAPWPKIPRSLSNRIRVNTRPAQPRLHPAEPPWTVIPWPLQDLSQGCPLLTVKKMSESGKEKWG